MIYRKLSLGLAGLSFAIGAIELFGARRIARALDAEDSEKLVKAFGAREAMAGAAILQAPADSMRVWNRVGGDAADLAALGAAAVNSPRNKFVWGALAFVVAATVLDVVVANGLDATTGKTMPIRPAPDPAE